MLEHKQHLFFDSLEDLDQHLQSEGLKADGFWLVFYKPSLKKSNLDWNAIVEVCLANGWIDSLPGKVDDEKTRIYISPRKLGSGWSRRNQLLVQELQSKDRLNPNGIAVIERAKADGSWSLFDAAEDLILPEPLVQAFESNSRIKDGWQSFTTSQQKQQLQKYYLLKSDAAREKQLDAITTACLHKLAGLS